MTGPPGIRAQGVRLSEAHRRSQVGPLSLGLAKVSRIAAVPGTRISARSSLCPPGFALSAASLAVSASTTHERTTSHFTPDHLSSCLSALVVAFWLSAYRAERVHPLTARYPQAEQS